MSSSNFSPELSFRDAGPEDARFIYEVRTDYTVAVHLLGPEWFPFNPRWLAEHPGRVFIALCDGQRAGYGQIRPKNRAAELGVCIAPTWQGRGVGKALAAHMLRVAFDELGLEWVWLRVKATNRKAITMYRCLGFERTGEVDRGRVWYMRCERG